MHSDSDVTLVGVFPYALVVILVYIVYIRYFTGLRRIPGPFIASFSNLWKLRAAVQEDLSQQNIALHKKYGLLVRIGPNMISVDDPAALNVIYGFKPIYNKVGPNENDGSTVEQC